MHTGVNRVLDPGKVSSHAQMSITQSFTHTFIERSRNFKSKTGLGILLCIILACELKELGESHNLESIEIHLYPQSSSYKLCSCGVLDIKESLSNSITK